MKQISLLRSLIRETIDEMELDEMARISTGYKLTDNWQSLFSKLPDSIQRSTRYERIINYLKDNPEAAKLQMAMDLGYREQQAINQLVNTLEAAGVVEKTGLTKEPMAKSPSVGSGIKGRPAVFNRDILDQGASVIKKFAKGDTNYTPEEIDFIKSLYSSFQ
jgi:predicted ArsR family transcriptional regulator